MKKKEIVIGSDHAGYDLKEYLKKILVKTGWIIVDKGTDSTDSVDYPDFAHGVAEELEGYEDKLGILICGSANGVSMAANKHKGVRAAIAWTPELASLARIHNNANVLSLPARFISEEDAAIIMDAFLHGEFEGGRHQRRVEKIDAK